MIEVFLYAIRIAIPLAALTFLYGLFLKNEKHFRLNRIFLLTGLIFMFTFPVWKELFTSISSKLITGYNLPSLTITANGENPELSYGYSPLKILSIIYIIGTLFFATRFLFRLAQILLLAFRHKEQGVNGFIPVYVKGNRTPFTFFNLLFLSVKSSVNTISNEILDHEDAHRKQLHSVDKIVVELACIVQWFNPAIWLCRMYLDATHEFLADKYVLDKGYNRFEYQKLMVEGTTGIPVSGLSNYFNATLLKKRIIMMSTNKSNRISSVKYILSFTAVFSFLALYTISNDAYAQDPPEDVFFIVETMPEYPGGNMELRNFVAKNIVYPETAKEAGVEGKVYVQFVVNEKGQITEAKAIRTDLEPLNKIDEVVVVGNSEEVTKTDIAEAQTALETEAVRVISLASDFKPGEQRGQKVKVQYTFPITFALN